MFDGGESNLKVNVVTPCALSFTCITIKLFGAQVQQHLPNNQDIQQSLAFMCTLHHVHLHHLIGQIITADSQHKFQQFDLVIQKNSHSRCTKIKFQIYFELFLAGGIKLNQKLQIRS